MMRKDSPVVARVTFSFVLENTAESSAILVNTEVFGDVYVWYDHT